MTDAATARQAAKPVLLIDAKSADYFRIDEAKECMEDWNGLHSNADARIDLHTETKIGSGNTRLRFHGRPSIGTGFSLFYEGYRARCYRQFYGTAPTTARDPETGGHIE